MSACEKASAAALADRLRRAITGFTAALIVAVAAGLLIGSLRVTGPL